MRKFSRRDFLKLGTGVVGVGLLAGMTGCIGFPGRQGPTPTPLSVAGGPSKLGLHTIKPDGAFPFVKAVREAGAHVALVKALGGLGLLREVKAVSPETITVGRVGDVQTVEVQGDPAETAGWVMETHMARWVEERDVTDYWEVLNEVDPAGVEGHLWLARFYLRALEMAEAQGFKLALFSYSTGVPEMDEWAAIVETGIFARARQGGHILALHEYGWPRADAGWGAGLAGQKVTDPDRGILMGRYRHLYRDFLIPRDEVIPLAITECGLDSTVVGQPMSALPADFLEQMKWYDDVLTADEYVLGGALFTLGGDEGWGAFNVGPFLPELQAYIIQRGG